MASTKRDAAVDGVLVQLLPSAAGAPPDILTKAKPHVGTDRIRETVKRMRRDIQGMGGEFRSPRC